MKYVHAFTGEAIERDEGAVHWPWIAPERAEVRDRIARARTAAREAVSARLGSGTVPAGSSVVSRREADAASEVRSTRRRARRTAERATSEPEASGDA